MEQIYTKEKLAEEADYIFDNKDRETEKWKQLMGFVCI